MWVGLMGFGHYMFLLLQVAYYACRLPLVYVAAGGVVFLLFFLSMAAPGLVVLALVGFFVAVALALLFGVRSGVFHYSWLVAAVWIFLWNLVGGLLSMPARLVFGAGEMWLWWEQPPAHPAYALAVGAAGAASTSILGRLKTLVKRICQAAPAAPQVGGTGAGRRRQDPAEVAADRVAGVYAVVVDACVVGFSPPYKTTW